MNYGEPMTAKPLRGPFQCAVKCCDAKRQNYTSIDPKQHEMVFFPQSDSICKIRLRMCEPKNPRRSTPPTTSHATPPGHIPFTHHQPHLNSHPTRNTPSHLPAQRLPPKSAIKHHHRHSQQQATSSTTPPSHIRETSQTTPSATPCPTPPATSVIRHYQ